MKKIVFLMGACALLLSMTACKSNPNKAEKEVVATTDNSQNALDWTGSYQGTLPCADCSGIETVVTLNSDNTYKMTTRYLGKGDNEIFDQTGTFQWTEDGGSIVLNNVNGEEGTHTVKVGENGLIWLDSEGQVITGELAEDYHLNKVDSQLVDKYWKLIEISGKPVTKDDVAKEAFIQLHALGSRINGNAGCNTFFGSYKLTGNTHIRFSQVGSTMMMCLNMDVENQMKKVLETADSYVIKGDTLALNRARMATLARFVAVEEE